MLLCLAEGTNSFRACLASGSPIHPNTVRGIRAVLLRSIHQAAPGPAYQSSGLEKRQTIAQVVLRVWVQHLGAHLLLGGLMSSSLQSYAADSHTFSSPRACHKSQKVQRSLVPGCMLYWRTKCWVCVCFHVMADAHSLKIVFGTLITKWHDPLASAWTMPALCSNAECEPCLFCNTKVLIDQSHFWGHKDFSPAYNTGATTCVKQLASLNWEIPGLVVHHRRILAIFHISSAYCMGQACVAKKFWA